VCIGWTRHGKVYTEGVQAASNSTELMPFPKKGLEGGETGAKENTAKGLTAYNKIPQEKEISKRTQKKGFTLKSKEQKEKHDGPQNK